MNFDNLDISTAEAAGRAAYEADAAQNETVAPIPFESAVPFNSTDIRRRTLLEDGYEPRQEPRGETWWRNGERIGLLAQASMHCSARRDEINRAIRFLSGEGYHVAEKPIEDPPISFRREIGIGALVAIIFALIFWTALSWQDNHTDFSPEGAVSAAPIFWGKA